jgi:hypothetical protein
MIRLSIHPSEDNITYEKEVIKIGVDGNSVVNVFLQPLVIERSPRDNRIVTITGICIDSNGDGFTPVSIQFPRHGTVSFLYSVYSIGEDKHLDALERSYEEYSRLRSLLGLNTDSHESPTRARRRW